MQRDDNYFEKAITYLAQLSNKEKVLLFISLFGFVYVLRFNVDAKDTSSFFIVVFAIIIYIITNISSADKKQARDDISKYIKDIESTVVNHSTPEMVVETVYKLHKPIKNLRFVKNNQEASNVVYYLRFLQIYDNEMFLDFIIYLEFFLKIHFNVMIEKYDIKTNYSILQDMRYELLNTLQSYHFNIPNHSSTFDSGDLDERLRVATAKLQAMTYRYMKIIQKKYKQQLLHIPYKGEVGLDHLKNNKYHIY
jgi:hypothetical protein